MAKLKPRIRLAPDDAAGAWGPQLDALAGEALERAEARLGLRYPEQVRIISFASEWEFHRYLGQRPTHVVAVARPRASEIVILRPVWVESMRLDVLVHEMTHLIIGRLGPGELPAWLSEGLAMVTSGEANFQSSWRLSVAGALGALLPIGRLENEVAIGGENQALAYAQSLSMTRFFLSQTYPAASPHGDNPAPLARDLADPVKGPLVLEKVWDPNFSYAFDRRWRRSNRTVWNWIAALSGGSFVWLVGSLLFLLAWWRKQRMASMVRERFQEEEARDAELGLEPPPWEYEGEEDDDERK